MRRGPRRSSLAKSGSTGVSRTVLTLALIVVVAIAGIALYVHRYPPRGQTRTSSSSPDGDRVGGARDLADLPGRDAELYADQVSVRGTPSGTLTVRAFPPSGISFVAQPDLRHPLGETQSIPVVLRPDLALPGNYSVDIETS